MALVYIKEKDGEPKWIFDEADLHEENYETEAGNSFSSKYSSEWIEQTYLLEK